MSKEVVHLFSSDQRDTYRQDILNVIAAPEGYLYKWRYQSKWVQPSDVRGLIGMHAVLWCVPTESGQVVAFIPLRRAVIVDAREDQGYVFVQFALGDRVEPKSNYTELTEELNRSSGALLPPKKLLFLASDLQGLQSTATSWTTLSNELAKYEQFKEVAFFKFQPMRRTDDNIKKPENQDGAVLDFVEDAWYELPYQFRQVHPKPNAEGVHVSIVTQVSEGVYTTSPPTMPVGSPYDSGILRFRGRSTHTDNYGYVRLSTESPLKGFALEFNLVVKPNTATRLLTALGFAIGAVLVGLPSLLPTTTLFSVKALLLAMGFVLIVLTKAFGPGERLNK